LRVNKVPGATSVEFSKALFWDISMESLDLEEHARFIVGRVVSRGSVEEWNLLKKIYGKERIKHEALSIRYLDKRSISFLSAYFGLERTRFRCCS
jgi:hypothetical protein